MTIEEIFVKAVGKIKNPVWIDLFEKGDTVINSYRNSGKTTTSYLYCFWYALTHPNSHIVIESEYVYIVIQWFSTFIVNLNLDESDVLVYNDKIVFKNGSKINPVRNIFDRRETEIDLFLSEFSSINFISQIINTIHALKGRTKMIFTTTGVDADVKKCFLDNGFQFLHNPVYFSTEKEKNKYRRFYGNTFKSDFLLEI